MVREVSPAEFVRDRAANPRTLLLDVREGWELKIASLPGVLHMPMAEIPGRLAELDRTRDIVVMCRSGGRSLSVARLLEAQGYPSVGNLTGGILAWSRDIDPTLATY
ncbi:MAG TPA: rhodanese-like domain-containing protein [Steroidobacteraceae bacterium]|nr:rhodanese-like domain-containing protein [Steroidobacteraceae bacterium]